MKPTKKTGLSHLLLLLMVALFSPLVAQGETILVMGDSLSAGYGIQEKEAWPNLLRDTLKKQGFGHYLVVNASISGETTAGGAARLPVLLAKHQPDIVILELGANDGLRGLPLKTMEKNLDGMIRRSREQKATVVLAGMRIPPNYGKRYTTEFHQVFHRLAQQHALALIPFLLEGLPGEESYFQEDGLHPTAKAQPLIRDRVWESLRPLLQAGKETVRLGGKK